MANSRSPRPLRQEERDLLIFLIENSHQRSVGVPAEAKVFDLQDGGMGSIRFFEPAGRHFGHELVRAESTDLDGVLVSIAVNLDDKGHLLELDFWKVDFSPLKRYPKPDQLTIRPSSH